MKGVKIAAGILLTLVAVLWGYGYTLDSNYKVSRSIIISTDSETLMENVADFNKWKKWGVWFLRDQDMKVTVSGTPMQVGHTVEWQSISQGNGSMTLTSINDQGITYDLSFSDVNMASDGQVSWQAKDNGYLVTWSDMGDVGDDVVGRYFVLFIDSMIGPDFAEGLANLKKVLEK